MKGFKSLQMQRCEDLNKECQSFNDSVKPSSHDSKACKGQATKFKKTPALIVKVLYLKKTVPKH